MRNLFAVLLTAAMAGCSSGAHDAPLKAAPPVATETMAPVQAAATPASATTSATASAPEIAKATTAATAAPIAKSALTEDEKIERLIVSLRETPSAKFIRNGQSYSVDEAMAHLRTKLAADRKNIKTANDFIARLASGSSITGQPYQIEMPDGTRVESGPWFQKQLQKLQ